MKLLVWVAISEQGLSAPLFWISIHAINDEMYRNDCICDHMQPFIEELYGEEEIISWPDLARAHYACAIVDLLDELDVPYIPPGRM